MIIRKERSRSFVHRTYTRKCFAFRECCRAKSKALLLLFTLSFLSLLGRLQLSILRSLKLMTLHGSTCTCASAFDSMTPIDVVKQGCNDSCPGGGVIRCGGPSAVSLYLGFDTCQVVNDSTSQVATDESHIGCFRNDFDFPLSERFVTNPSECILHCEFNQFPLAVMNDPTLCHCAHYSTGFSSNASSSPSMCNRTCNGIVIKSEDAIGCGGPGHVSVWRTMAEENCGEKSFLDPGTVPLTALVSMPGSGNTWLRYMLETASGIFTGSVYSDKSVTSAGLFGEMDPINMRRTLTVKDHIYLKTLTGYPNAYDKIVLLVRNPYDALIAEFNRRTTKQHVGVADTNQFYTGAWHNYVVSTKVEWQLIHEHVLRGDLPVLVVFYDQLLADKNAQIRRILDFVQYYPTDLDKRLFCLQRNDVGHFKRKNRGNFDPFTPDLVEQLNDSIISLRQVIADFGLGEVPRWERPVVENI